MRFEAVLFDVDGTLIHSSPGIFSTLRHTFAQMGTDITGVDLQRYVGPPLRDTFAEYYNTEAEVERAVEIYRVYYAETGQHQCNLYPGALELLERLRAAGLRLFTATCKPVEVVTPILIEQGILPYLTAVGGASMDTSVDTKTAVIEQVLHQNGLAAGRTLMVGDRADDLQGAQNCGLPAVGVLYGYGSRAELTPFAPALLAGSCAELGDYILQAE